MVVAQHVAGWQYIGTWWQYRWHMHPMDTCQVPAVCSWCVQQQYSNIQQYSRSVQPTTEYTLNALDERIDKMVRVSA